MHLQSIIGSRVVFDYDHLHDEKLRVGDSFSICEKGTREALIPGVHRASFRPRGQTAGP